MKQVTINLFEFDELSEDAKKEAIELNRDINIDDEYWHEPIIERATEMLHLYGFRDIVVNFSGVCSQGDGSSFAADLDLAEYIKWTKQEKKYQGLKKVISEDRLGIYIVRTDHRYSHEYTCQADWSNSGDELTDRQGKLAEKLLEDVEATRCNLSLKIYRDLRNYYDEITTDEAIAETFRANEYTFEASGKMHNA